MLKTNSSTWLTFIRSLPEGLHFRSTWENQGSLSQTVAKQVESQFRFMYARKWEEELQSLRYDPDSKLRCYVKIKQSFICEPYVKCVSDYRSRSNIARLRTSAHNLHIERGRYHRPEKTPLEKRTCNVCTNSIEDEFHFISKCPAYTVFRNRMLEQLRDIFVLHDESDSYIFQFVLGSQDYEAINILRDYLDHVTAIRGSL